MCETMHEILFRTFLNCEHLSTVFKLMLHISLFLVSINTQAPKGMAGGRGVNYWMLRLNSIKILYISHFRISREITVTLYQKRWDYCFSVRMSDCTLFWPFFRKWPITFNKKLPIYNGPYLGNTMQNLWKLYVWILD